MSASSAKRLISIYVVRNFVCLYALVLMTSCGYRTLEGTVKPVYFSTDPIIFTDTAARFQAIYYQEKLSHPCLEMVDLHNPEIAKAFISKPTLVKKDDVEYLVYPREHIFITANASDGYVPVFSTVSKNRTRDGELLVLKTFHQLEKHPAAPKWLSKTGDIRLFEYNFQTILELEKVVKNQIVICEQRSQQIFDSLCNVYQVSKKFKKLTKDYIHNRYDGFLPALYDEYRDTLQAHDVLQAKVRALLQAINKLTETGQFTLNVEHYTNYLYTCLFPKDGIRNMVVQGGLEACFDSIVANFEGHARDYLLSRVMFRAYTQGVDVPANYREKYRHYSMNKDYRRIVARAARQMEHSPSDTRVFPNELLTADEKTKVRLQDVLAQYKGKYIIIDLWASWCVPCIEEIPAFQALRKKYSEDKITFLNVSVDNSVSLWHSRLRQLQGDSLTNYFLLNQNNTMLAKQIGLTSIPRYLLYDQEGRLINMDAPGPSDLKLGEILDKLLVPLDKGK